MGYWIIRGLGFAILAFFAVMLWMIGIVLCALADIYVWLWGKIRNRWGSKWTWIK